MMIKLGETFALFLNRVKVKVKPELSLDFTRYDASISPSRKISSKSICVGVCCFWVSWTQDQKRSDAPCWTTHRSAVAGGRDAFLVITPLAPVGVGSAAGTVREPVAPLVHCD